MWSDVQIAESRWRRIALLFVLLPLHAIWLALPVVVTRRRYSHLLECEAIRDDALRIIHDPKRTLKE